MSTGRFFQILIHRDGKAELREDVKGASFIIDVPDEPLPPKRTAETFFEPLKTRQAVFESVTGGAVWTPEERAIREQGKVPYKDGEPHIEFYVRILRERE